MTDLERARALRETHLSADYTPLQWVCAVCLFLLEMWIKDRA